jgi:ATP-dependent Clp protease protease subunit
MAPKKKQQEEKQAEENVNIAVSPEEFQGNIVMLPSPEQELPKMRTIGLIGDVDEEKASDVIYALLTLKQLGEREETDAKGKTKTVFDPIELYISTHGGSASDMFAIYDVMRQIKKQCPIETVGIGKVMSAGVLLLAAGTKGKRKIGKNCRVMIHSVLGGNEGPLHNLENELAEIRWTQERYIQALIDETKLTQTTMNKLLQKHVNIYLSAEEAVKYGIADEVI